MGLSRRKFTKEFKEEAVRRLDLGASLAEVARACEVNPNVSAPLAARAAGLRGQGFCRQRATPRGGRPDGRTGAESRSPGIGDRFFAAMLAACRGAAQAASIDYPRLVYPYLEKEMSLATPIPLERLCRLAHVSRAGYYRWQDTPPTVDPDLDLRDEIQRIALESPSYGWPRITAELHRRGWETNHKRAYRIMREGSNSGSVSAGGNSW